ncbi:major facilitator superfamily transporter, involved in Hassallidin biosynthesis [Planktothrix serta PCC 8927]|uniref:Major facilitator superfamily transporter, involved in Hassallidin biosynthesis n=1 Tax=Planktothrix serta PCC 8927 TaxID=671068 RepID=A0A1J1JM83_9CYAN|nr:MFS transporter [Planktothrix serta]CZT62790.1 major facilitator superfamily transporter, involved in Hassallidin biosynthesis [Planktothrix serta PCC 8927]VXD10561.1 major facilitator superfamily transporter, involved in Hassallidin biosynthesis [Planktothrix serta PCC 8927]
MRIFTFIWFGQLVSLISIWMTGFALDISVFKQTGSATQFAFLIITSTVPLVIISPVAGTLVDHWNRRWTMIITHLFAGISSLILILIVTSGQLQIEYIYLRNIFASLIGAFHAPAYKTAITSIVSQEDLGRASGMVQLGIGIQQIISPLIAGILLDFIGLKGILMIDLSALIIALVPLFLLRFGEISQTNDIGENVHSTSFWEKIVYGWTYLINCPGLPSFLILYTIYQFLIGFVSVLVYPLILCMTTPSNLGKITFLGGVGMLLGSIVMSTWKYNLQNLINLVLFAMSLSGLCIAFAGFRPSLIEISLSTLLFFFITPVLNGLVQVFFQTRVVENVQGRVFALTGAISGAAIPIAALFAGPLADYIFEPLMAFDGPWSKELVGQLIGSGPGRGIGLLFVIVGFFLLIIPLIGYQFPTLRQLDDGNRI